MKVDRFKTNILPGYILTCILTVMLFSPVEGMGQRSKYLTEKYSAWSVEVSGGLPFLVGNLTSFSAEKMYIGNMYGVRAAYQWSRELGFALSVTKGQNKVGARDYAAGFLLGVDGNTYYFPQEITTYPYKDISSDINFMSFGLHGEVNIINLLGGSSINYWCSVLVMPAFYVQRFSAVVRTKSDNREIFPSRSAMSFGMGGELALRVRTGRFVDLQLRSGLVWMSDNDFIGFSTPIKARYNYMWNTAVGVIFKIPQKGKRENLMYMPREGDCIWQF